MRREPPALRLDGGANLRHDAGEYRPLATTRSELPVIRRCIPLAAALALAACASGPGNWTKPGATDESTAFDADESEFIADAASLSKAAQSDNTYIGVSATGQATTTQLPGTESLSFMERADAFERCMAGRGYRRAAVN